MPKRLLAVLILILWPFAALADDAAPAPDPAAVAAPVTTPATASSNGLGPQTAGSAGGSNADSAALQPAGTSPLQSNTADATGITAPTRALQAPVASSADLKVLAGEADGSPHAVASEPDPTWPWALAAIVLAVILGAAVAYRDRRRFRSFH